MRRITCINCSLQGHTFKDCLKPVTSCGILAFKRTPELKFLLIQRKDSIGYIDFIRGKYDFRLSKSKVYKTLAEEMTVSEKNRILSIPFDGLWDLLWVNKNSRAFLNEYDNAKSKFLHIDIYNMLTSTESKWSDQEFGIPKGRRNNNETNIDCAAREFVEETGYKRHEFKIIDQNLTLEEIFTGSNGITYKHIYYLAEILTNRAPVIDETNFSQIGEVKGINWFTFKECINIFRDYDTTKRSIIYRARKIIEKIFGKTGADRCSIPVNYSLRDRNFLRRSLASV
jgi:8-oxo-dGTP pyrophosphatase MutT (NUDIX family)